MKIITRRAATVVAAGALGVAGLAAPAPAGHGPFADPRPTSAPTADRGGTGMGPGYGLGMGYRRGGCLGLGLTAERGTLTGAQKTTLRSMAQEEKLAHDLYAAFAARYDVAVFNHIAMTETHHLTAVRTLLQRYDLSDPTANRPVGEFSDPALQAAYDKLRKRGETSLSAALAVGQQVERDDIAALTAGLDGLAAADVRQIYTRLLASSERHLTVLTRWSTR